MKATSLDRAELAAARAAPTGPGGNKLGIVAAGGPAPGINSVIGAATIRARLTGVEVVGIQDGFKWLMEGDVDHVLPLAIEGVSRIHFRGGSHIGISRANPTKTAQHLERTLDGLRRLGISMLMTIGGDGTACLANLLAARMRGELRLVHVPKTIDNDLDLPHDTSTFGFQTARHVGAEIVKNLMVDAKTTSRWYFVVAQGRKAGHLALSIGKAVGATLSIIPEEFPRARTHWTTIVDTLAGAVIKRLAYGRDDGVAMLAEGLAECVDPAELSQYTAVPRDAFGNIHVAKINLGDLLKTAVEERLGRLGVQATIMAKSIGYEVRCADPIPFDMEYTRDLGYCAARFVIEGGTAAMVTMTEGRFRAVPFSEVIDPTTGRTRVRMVDIHSDRYKIARSYMLRLKREDFEDPAELARLAKVAGMAPEKFRETFGALAQGEPMPMSFAPVAAQTAPPSTSPTSSM